MSRQERSQEMPADLLLPQWGMGMNDGIVVKWLKSEGDQVETGEPVVEIEAAKVTGTVESPSAGTLGRIVAPEGTVVPTGTRLAIILAPGETEADLPSEAAPTTPAAGAPRQVTPVARRVAGEMGVDVTAVTGTGPGGRVTEADVRKAAEEGPAAVPSVVPVKEVQLLSGMHAAVARNMTVSWQAPIVTLHSHVDVTDLAALQAQKTREWRQYRIRAQLQDLALVAVARALKENPRANAHLVGNEVRLLDQINIGIAIALPEGLIVPVIHDADKKTPLEMAQAVRDLATRAKNRELTVDDTTLGTFTVTNLGAYGVEHFSPLLNPPEVGILAMGRAEQRPAVHEGEICIRSIIHLSLTFDHRAWDGAPAGVFLRAVCGLVTEPSWITELG